MTRDLLLILVLLLGLEGGLGDAVQVTLARLGDATTALVLVLLEDANLLEGLQDLAVDGAGGVDVVSGARAAVLGAAVGLPQAADTDGLAHVDVAGDGGGADVEPGSVRARRIRGRNSLLPVNALGRQLLGVGCLDGVGPTCRPPSQHAMQPTMMMPPVPHGIQVSHEPIYIPLFCSHGPGMGSLP
ncbi:hypothetical protein Tdes44962_MAKER10082 [Teratosphaeria destructans]|uniref:Secreted protein n=1 Tax=Teratosphaeria destructans TaxID=418781 RepID=A0A9W7W0U1_9PEZI|nr:hypothetical protein Tdes44962_MAKER10082 [Teratosphaeria destructans]